MRKTLTIMLAGLLLTAFAAPAFAWEFSMSGDYEERFRYFARTGGNDLFGVQGTNEEVVGMAGPSHFGIGQVAAANNGNPTITRQGFSQRGSDAMYLEGRVRFNPTIRVNKAIRVAGRYVVGGPRNKLNRTQAGLNNFAPEEWFMERSGNSVLDAFGIGYWEQLKMVIQTPWAIIAWGPRNFPLGCGSVAHGAMTRSDTFFVAVPYGPLTIFSATHVARHSFTNFGNSPDRDQKNTYFGAVGLNYKAANLDTGIAYYPQWIHRGTQGLNGANAAPATVAADIQGDIFWAWAKYNNGRFFANAEYFWKDVKTRYIGGPGYAGNWAADVQYAPLNEESFGAFAEVGTVVGPSKLSFVFAEGSGVVLNNNNPTKSYDAHSIHPSAMEPYQRLLFETYGGGNNQFVIAELTTPTSKGSMSDAYALAARLDYAVASNLNVWGSYLWAHRLERAGYYRGHYNTTGAVASVADRNTFYQRMGAASDNIVYTNSRTALGGAFGQNNRAAYIPDGFLGWEVNAGVDWKLLENMTWRQRFAYWQPGQWFNYAYQAYLPDNNLAGTTAGYFLNTRDAIAHYEAALVIDF